jgi:hypothetical protein
MVSLEDRIKKVLREHYGDFTTVLELEYENKLITELLEENDHNRNKWATYNQVMLEFKENIKDITYLKELQFRLIDQEDPQSVCVELLENLEYKTPELDRLYHKIRNFISE